MGKIEGEREVQQACCCCVCEKICTIVAAAQFGVYAVYVCATQHSLMMHSGKCVGASERREQTKFMYQLSSTNLMSCCYSAFELLLLLGTWPSACYQRVDVLSQLLQTATLRLSYCLVRGHMLPTTAWRRSLAATISRPATLRLSCCLVRGPLLLDSSSHVGFQNNQ